MTCFDNYWNEDDEAEIDYDLEEDEMERRYTYKDHDGRHWIREDDLDTMIIQNAQENVCDLGGHPNIVGWEEYGRRVDEMIKIIIECRVADGEEVRAGG